MASDSLQEQFENPGPPVPSVPRTNANIQVAARMLYRAHKSVQFDTDEDRQAQADLLAEAHNLWPEIDT